MAWQGCKSTNCNQLVKATGECTGKRTTLILINDPRRVPLHDVLHLNLNRQATMFLLTLGNRKDCDL